MHKVSRHPPRALCNIRDDGQLQLPTDDGNGIPIRASENNLPLHKSQRGARRLATQIFLRPQIA